MKYVYPLDGGNSLEVSDTDINGENIRVTEVRPDKKIKHRARKIYFKNDNAFFIWYGQRYHLTKLLFNRFCRVE